MKRLKIIGAVFYTVVTLPLLAILFWSIPSLLGSDIGWNALGGVILMVYTSVIAFTLYLVPIIIGVVGLCKNKNVLEIEQAKRNKRHFVLMIILPILTTLLNFLTYYLFIMF